MNIFKNKHANQRYFERLSPDIASKRDIVKAIQNPKNIQFIKRLTETRSMAYVHLPNDNVVKVILNKRKREIITILPWIDIYKTKEKIILNNNVYMVDLYPDCYMETENQSTLNKVKRVIHEENDIFENINFNCVFFDIIVIRALNQYMERKEKNEEKIGTEKEKQI